MSFIWCKFGAKFYKNVQTRLNDIKQNYIKTLAISGFLNFIKKE